jgi:hypothetical protein
MNGYTHSSLEDDNCETLRRLAGLPAFGIVPALAGVDVEKLMIGNLREAFEKTINIEEFIKGMGDL